MTLVATTVRLRASSIYKPAPGLDYLYPVSRKGSLGRKK